MVAENAITKIFQWLIRRGEVRANSYSKGRYIQDLFLNILDIIAPTAADVSHGLYAATIEYVSGVSITMAANRLFSNWPQ
jgi:hypothetical protein